MLSYKIEESIVKFYYYETLVSTDSQEFLRWILRTLGKPALVQAQELVNSAKAGKRENG